MGWRGGGVEGWSWMSRRRTRDRSYRAYLGPIGSAEFWW
jgi:hypothetical protein